MNYRGEDLPIAAAQLLQGRPLKGAITFFETGAVHAAIAGASATAHQSQSWLNVLNTIDPQETAEALRRSSAAIAPRPTEPGVHPELNKRIASLLLWRTGYSLDARTAWLNDPKIDHWMLYETDYLPDPSKSFFRLERRQLLRCSAIRNFRFPRIERAKDALLDRLHSARRLLTPSRNWGPVRLQSTISQEPPKASTGVPVPPLLGVRPPDRDIERRRMAIVPLALEHRFGRQLARDVHAGGGNDESEALRHCREGEKRVDQANARHGRTYSSRNPVPAPVEQVRGS